MGRLRLLFVPGKCGQGCPRSQRLVLVPGVLTLGGRVLVGGDFFVLFFIGCNFEFEIFGGEVGAGRGVEEAEGGLGFGVAGVFGLVQVGGEVGELGLVGREEKRQKFADGGVGGWRD